MTKRMGNSESWYPSSRAGRFAALDDLLSKSNSSRHHQAVLSVLRGKEAPPQVKSAPQRKGPATGAGHRGGAESTTRKEETEWEQLPGCRNPVFRRPTSVPLTLSKALHFSFVEQITKFCTALPQGCALQIVCRLHWQSAAPLGVHYQDRGERRPGGSRQLPEADTLLVSEAAPGARASESAARKAGSRPFQSLLAGGQLSMLRRSGGAELLLWLHQRLLQTAVA